MSIKTFDGDIDSKLADFRARANGITIALSSSNTCAFGALAAGSITTGANNTCFGRNSGGALTTGNYNTFGGWASGQAVAGGSENTGYGALCLPSLTTGSGNLAIGYGSAYTLSTGSNNLYIGNVTYFAAGGNNNTIIGHQTSGGDNFSNTIIISDGANTQNIIADAASCRTKAPLRPPTYAVVALPSAAVAGAGATVYCSNGRKAAELAGAGTGCMVWSNGSAWLTYYNNAAVVA